MKLVFNIFFNEVDSAVAGILIIEKGRKTSAEAAST